MDYLKKSSWGNNANNNNKKKWILYKLNKMREPFELH